MADNVNLTAGDGTIIAGADVIGGVAYPRAKVVWGPDNTVNDTDVASGKPMPVQLRKSDGTDVSGGLPVTIATAPVLVAGTALIGKVGLDQTTDGTTNKVAADLRVAGSAVAVGAGASGSTVPRVTLASDSPGIITTGTAGSASSVVLTVQGVASMTPVLATTAGAVAHGSADSGNPQKMGGRARSSEIAAVTSDNRSDLVTDLVGKLIVLPYANPENFVSGAITSAMTGTTSTSLVAAPASGLRNYITTIIVSCAHATQGTDVIIQDGSGGTTLMTIPAAAVYGGAVVNLPVPLRQPTTATALFCANVTTGSSTKVSAVGYKGA